MGGRRGGNGEKIYTQQEKKATLFIISIKQI